MKNHRDVSFATNAGYIEYKGFLGRVTSGCPNTPYLKSRYCKVHTPTVATPQSTQSQQQSTKSNTKEDQVGLIIGKRVTRLTTFYEVNFLSTVHFAAGK